MKEALKGIDDESIFAYCFGSSYDIFIDDDKYNEYNNYMVGACRNGIYATRYYTMDLGVVEDEYGVIRDGLKQYFNFLINETNFDDVAKLKKYVMDNEDEDLFEQYVLDELNTYKYSFDLVEDIIKAWDLENNWISDVVKELIDIIRE